MSQRTQRTSYLAVWFALFIWTAGVPCPLAAEGSETLIALVEAPKLDQDRGVHVTNVEIDMGPGTLAIGNGILVPAVAVSGHALEMVFIGDARFRIDPDDPIEFAQLEMFADEAPLVSEVTHAVLVVGDAGITERLTLAGETTISDAGLLEEAENLFAEWAEGPQRKGFDVPAAIVKVVAGEPQAAAFFAVWCRSPDLGDFYYSIDPFRPEQVALGQFVPLADSTRNFIRRYNERGKWYGRFSDFDLIGHWDTWISTSLKSNDGKPSRGSSGFESEHYSVDLTVDPRYKTDTSGTARIRARAVSEARRTVDLLLYSGLTVKGVWGGEDLPLEWIRSEGSLTVLLPQEVGKGELVELRIEYEGNLIQKIETYEASRDKPFRLLSTNRWYPRVGSIDRATYDVTLRAPVLFDLVASGSIVDSGKDGKIQWQRRRLEVPAISFTFEIGRFDFVNDRAGHVNLTFAFPRHRFSLVEDTRRRIIDTTKQALTFFEERFGPYPLDSMSVVVVVRGFSQGYLSFVTLAEGAMREPLSVRRKKSRPEWADESRDLTIAHELSHQWWGNWVGWDTYRDQWLSEALAGYSALMFGATRADSGPRFLVRNAVDWRSSVSRVGSLGPVTLGYRLTSSKGEGYQAIVYDKGAVVIRMLSRLLGDGPFQAMLGELAKAVGNRVIDTPTFLLALERMSGFDLESFADSFVYGTKIPDAYYRYDVEQREEDGQWILKGEVHLASRGERRCSLRYSQDGHWQVEPDFSPHREVQELSGVVPFQIIVTSPADIERNKKNKNQAQSAQGFGGQLLLQGAVTEFEYVVPQRPERMDFDQFGEVLARFYDEMLRPKQSLYLRARRTADAGDLDDAFALLREALALPLYSERGFAWANIDKALEDIDLDEREKRLNASIRTQLARILIDKGSLDEAREQLVMAESLEDDTEHGSRWNARRILWSRLDLEQGQYESAFQRLKEKKSRWRLGAEGYAILAVAAHEIGREKMTERLLETAERRGADVSALRVVRAVRPTGG